MNLAELSPGIILVILGLSLLLLAILGTGRRKTLRVPVINHTVPTPRSIPQKTGVGIIGIHYRTHFE
jgi:hypothetical protein